MQMTIGGNKIQLLKEDGNTIFFLRLNRAGRRIGGVKSMTKKEFENMFPPHGLRAKTTYNQYGQKVIRWQMGASL